MDVAAVAVEVGGSSVVQLLQLRAGAVASRFTYRVALPEGCSSRDHGEILQSMLEKHYLESDAAEIPTELVTQHKLVDKQFMESLLQ